MTTLHPLVVFLVEERARQGLSQRGLARQADIHQSQLCDWEHGVKSPSLDSLTRWMAGLGLCPAAAPDVSEQSRTISNVAARRGADQHGDA